ncbi:MAG: DUF1285 domain-containing protein [Kiloniellaceae bacterium]
MPADQSPGQTERSRAKGAAGPGDAYDIRIARDGTWFHEGAPIGRKPLVKLFASVLWRDDGGDYWLRTPVEQGRIAVEDAPFTAVELSVRVERSGQILAFRTNLDDWVEADAVHPLRVVEDPEKGEISPYIVVRDRLEALILRPVYYELAELAVPPPQDLAAPKDCLGVWSHGVYFPLGSAR